MPIEQLADRLLQLGLSPAEIRDHVSTTFPGFYEGDPTPVFAPVRHKVCMLFTSRSGTTFFVDVLNRTRQFGRIGEHMNEYMVRRRQDRWGVTDMPSYITEVVRRNTTDNGVFGFKGTVEALLPLVQINELPEHVHDWHWIVVRRNDVVAQAVSLFRAKSSGRWHYRGKHPDPPPVPAYDYSAIERQVGLIQRRQGQIERFIDIHRLEPLRLVYEEYRDDPVPALRSVFRHVGLTPPRGLVRRVEKTRFEVLRNEETEELAERFRADLAKQVI